MFLYRKTNGRRDFGDIWIDEEIEYGMSTIINRYIYIL